MTTAATEQNTVQHASDEELQDLRAAIRDFLADAATEESVRAVADDHQGPGYDQSVWSQMSKDLGLTRLAVPEQFGGDGYGFLELRVVLEELGATLLPSPFLTSAVVAAQAVLASGDEAACARLLPGIGAGTTIATTAFAETSGRFEPTALATTATPSSTGWTLSGTKTFVPHALDADLVLVVADTAQGPGLFAVESQSTGFECRSLTSLDATRPLAEIRLTDVAATLIGDAGGAPSIMEKVLDAYSLALAAEQVGGARRCLENATAYAKERHQFGRAIGSFQAIKHKLADMLIRVELADAATEDAARAVSEGRADAASAVASAYVTASEAFEFVAAENVQVHGGIGFTWEHSAHLYFRRARADQNFLGGPSVAQERLLSALGI